MVKNNVLFVLAMVAFVAVCNVAMLSAAQRMTASFLPEECQGINSRSDPGYPDCLRVISEGLF
jgi:hypothetical protein